MAKDNREILHGISQLVPGVTTDAKGKTGVSMPTMKVFTSGMEDELAAAFTQAELKQMVERGDIAGNWKSTKK